MFDRRTGTYCAILIAGLPLLTSYAQETRMYSLVLLESVVLAASFVHAFVLGRRRFLPAFVASLTAALYTHSWALFLGLACLMSFLVLVRITFPRSPTRPRTPVPRGQARRPCGRSRRAPTF